MEDMMEKVLLRVRRSGPPVLLMLMLGLVAGCVPITVPAPAAANAAVAIPNVTVSVVDGKLVIPAEIPSGIVQFTYVGTNPDTEYVDIARLAEGATLDEIKPLLDASNDDPGPALEKVSIYGFQASDTISSTIIYDLLPGGYVVTLNAGAADMDQDLVPFTPGPDSGAAAPGADVSVEMDDFAYVMPDKIPAGPHLWEISNVGKQWHMMLIAHLADGQTVDDILKMMGEPGDDSLLGSTIVDAYLPMSPGNRAWVTIDLPPGNYAAVCPLPDLMGDMSPHAMKGMVHAFTVE